MLLWLQNDSFDPLTLWLIFAFGWTPLRASGDGAPSGRLGPETLQAVKALSLSLARSLSTRSDDSASNQVDVDQGEEHDEPKPWRIELLLE